MNARNPQRGKSERQRAGRTSDQRAALPPETDPAPFTAKELQKIKRVRPNVRAIRRKLGMSQRLFAEAFGLPLASLRDWEQGRSLPSRPARTLLWMIAEHPTLVRRITERERRA
jgi:putative transcriptional regulator